MLHLSRVLKQLKRAKTLSYPEIDKLVLDLKNFDNGFTSEYYTPNQ